MFTIFHCFLIRRKISGKYGKTLKLSTFPKYAYYWSSLVYSIIGIFAKYINMSYVFTIWVWHGEMGDFHPQTTPFLGWPMPPAVKDANFL